MPDGTVKVLSGVELVCRPGMDIVMPFGGLISRMRITRNGVEYIRLISPFCEAMIYGAVVENGLRDTPLSAGDVIGKAKEDRLGFMIVNIDPKFLSEVLG